jgi:hypothetical protein
LILRRAAFVRGLAVGAAIVRRSVCRHGSGGLHWAGRHSRRGGNAARHKGESRQKGQPESAHAIMILVRRVDFVNATHQRCDELTTNRPSGRFVEGTSD